MIRLCLSGEPYCSGLNPCQTCHLAVMTRVLPKAMIAAGFNQNPAIAQAFFEAYGQGWKELQAGLPPEAVRPLVVAPEPQPVPTTPEPPPPPLAETALTEAPPPEPSPPEPEEDIPPPVVEGLANAEEPESSGPPSATGVVKRRRNDPRAYRRRKAAAGSRNESTKED